MLKIGIVGYGVVGQATANMIGKMADIFIVDPDKGYKDDITECDIIYFCINEKNNQMKNLTEVIDATAKANKKCLFVIRTTTTPGYTEKIMIRHKREFAFMPEFLREWNAEDDARHPDKIVIGTESKGIFDLLSVFVPKDFPKEKIIQVRQTEAELAKLALNSLALLKVVFAEELYDLCEKLFVDYQSIYKIFTADQNINERHLNANQDGYRGASGKCLPKDTEFLVKYSKEKQSRMSLLETAEILNKLFLKVK